MPEVITYNSDTAERKKLFVGLSFSHPAKMHLSLQIDLIERFTKVGDTILDPMAGSGTLLIACALGRNVILVELEEKFVKMQQANWKKIKRLGPMLGYSMGQATLLQGDSRQLDNVLADACIFSPPYAEAHSNKNLGVGDTDHPDLRKRSYLKNNNPKQIANLPYGEIDKSLAKADVICTSPPYEGMKQDDKRANDPEQIDKRARAFEKAGGNFHTPGRLRTIARHYAGYNENRENIGNLKSDNYLSAMAQVYQQCCKVLKDGGLMILVVKNFIRDKKIVRLDLDTIKLCENAGFALTERLARKLTQQSFWRRIYMQKYPDAPKIDVEDVLIFRKDS